MKATLKKYSSSRLRWISIAMALTTLFGCGLSSLSGQKKDEDSTPVNPSPSIDPHAGIQSGAPATPVVPTPSSAPFACARQKNPTEFITSLSQDLFRRQPTAEEITASTAGSFDPAKIVDSAFANPDYDTGIAFFISNLLRLEQNLPLPGAAAGVNEIALIGDLRQEPVILAQRNKNKPWKEMFTTTKIYCTSRTAPLYDFPVDPTISGFVSCTMPPERAGLLGMVSVLRAFPSAFFLTNSNRHRVATALYLSQGLQLSAKTDGPVGEGRPMPMAPCVPQIDTRVTKDGLIFGTAVIPKVGALCAGCHSKYLAPLEPAFLRFGLKGQILNLSDIDNLPAEKTNTISKEVLKNIMTSGQNSCYSPNDPNDPPQAYAGLPGLAQLFADSSKLANALAIQIQQNLVNRTVDDNLTQAIVSSYKANGETLQAALRGFFLSGQYLCGQQGG